MYDITLNGKQLYHPNSLDCNVSSAVLHEKLNDAGYLDLTIPFTNPLWGEITEKKGEIIIYKENKDIWYGEVRDISVDFSKNKTVYVVGEAAYLNDTVQPQKQYKNITKYDLLETMVNIHNSMVEDRKKFQVGIVGENANVRRNCITDWEYTLDAIRKHICGDEEYVRIRHVNNVRYIDIMPIEKYGKHSDQNIMFGENMLDYVEESSGEQIASICIPLGSTLEEENIPDHENYLTIESVNSGKNYVYLPGAVDRIGKITKVVHFNVLSDPNALMTAGLNWLKEKQYASLTLRLSAVDLSVLHSDIDNYAVGDYVHAICEPMEMDAWFPVRERETDLLNLANNHITVGNVGTKSITTQQAEQVEEIESLMPKKDSILNQAKKNASALLNSAGKDGHVVFRQNDQGIIYEILIMDTPDIDTASKMWRFNENGIGYADAKDSKGQWLFRTAWTMDGHFNADAIVCDNLEVGKNVTMGPNARISWSAVNGKPDVVDKNSYADKQWLTQITKDTVTTSYVNALGITAQNISAQQLNGKILKMGGPYGYGFIQFYDANGKEQLSIDNGGFLLSGDYGSYIRLGFMEITTIGLGTYVEPWINIEGSDGQSISIYKSYGEPFRISSGAGIELSANNITITIKNGELTIGSKNSSGIYRTGTGYTGSSSGNYRFINGIAVAT